MSDTMEYLEPEMITEDVLLRWSATIQPIPLPEHLTPRSGVPLTKVPLESLMTVSPHIIAHMQRTAAQGGLQTISPRQIPFCKTMLRTPGGSRMLGDHVVGSIADEEMLWPTIDGDDMSHLLPDEPLGSPYIDHAMQPKTKTTPLTRANKMLGDPILACLIKGRAVVDVLRRDDVSGDADGLLNLLADAWDIPVSTLAELDAYTLGIDGPLLRHAIKSDEVYPMVYAPIHVRKVVSTGASEVTRQLLPEDTAMDWKRARVFCEAVFTLSISIEGHRYTDLRAIPPPGDPAAPTNRKGVMVFQPAPASAWSFSARSFSIYPLDTARKKRQTGIPKEVLTALSKYIHTVRPVSHALVAGHRAVARKSTAVEANIPSMETISEGYRLMVRTLVVGGARGRTAAATVRNLIYEAMMNAPADVKLRMSRYMSIAKAEVKTHLGLEIVPDSLINKLANKFGMLGEKIRGAVVAEAARRGASAEEWWSDILSQAPERYSTFVEGSHGWARVGLWLMFRGPSEKWDRLISAVKLSSMRDAAAGSAGAIALPAKKGSLERTLAAVRHTVKEVTKVFSAYYTGVADVGLCLADEATDMGKPRTAEVLREASYLWMLRGRAYRGANVNPIGRDEPAKSTHHYRVRSSPADLMLCPAPYRAYQAYVKHVEHSDIIPVEVKLHFKENSKPPISNAFATLGRPIAISSESTITKYALRPHLLAEDMERSWQELLNDVRRVANRFSAEAETPPQSPKGNKRPLEAFFTPQPLKIAAVAGDDYYSMLGRMDADMVDWAEDLVEGMDPEQAEMITTGKYVDVDHLVKVLSEHDSIVIPGASSGKELIR